MEVNGGKRLRLWLFISLQSWSGAERSRRLASSFIQDLAKFQSPKVRIEDRKPPSYSVGSLQPVHRVIYFRLQEFQEVRDKIFLVNGLSQREIMSTTFHLYSLFEFSTIHSR